MTEAQDSGSDCDHTQGRDLVANPEGHQYWPCLFEDEPRQGVRSDVVCAECGEELVVFYRIEEIVSTEGDAVWERYQDTEN